MRERLNRRIPLSSDKIGGFRRTKQECRWDQLGIVEMTEPRYAMLLQSQGGACAICGDGPKLKRLSVDHDPETGVVRGLLCHPCNTTVVSARSTNLLRKVMEYVEINSDAR